MENNLHAVFLLVDYDEKSPFTDFLYQIILYILQHVCYNWEGSLNTLDG